VAAGDSASALTGPNEPARIEVYRLTFVE